MSNARKDFLRRLKAFRSAIQDPKLVDLDPSRNQDYNDVAQLHRNGLAVMGFSVLEEFLRARVAEQLATIDPSVLMFAQLPEKLQLVCTKNALEGLLFKVKFLERGDQITKIQSEVATIATTGHQSFQLSPLAFGCSGSNISHSDITDFLEALNVDKPWETLTGLSKSLGMGIIPVAKDRFYFLSNNRHQAAHDAKTNIHPTELKTTLQNMLCLAVTFDLVTSTCIGLIRSANSDYLKGQKLNLRDISARWLKQTDVDEWKEYPSINAKKALNVSSNYDSLRTECLSRAKKKNEPIIITDSSSMVIEWVC